MAHATTGIRLDPDASEPLFRQIGDALADRILNGVYPPGFRLPPSRALAREVGTHRNTVVRAYELLGERGLVDSTVGRGTFVAEAAALAAPARTGPSRQAPSQRHIRWDNVMSRAAASEVLTRVDRLPRQPPSTATDTVDLTRFQPSSDLLPADDLRVCITHVLRTLGPRALGYAPRDGLPRLREQICIDLARLGVPARPEHIVVTTGSQQALDLVARALIDEGDPFLVEAETYSGAINLLTVAGARLVSVPTDPSGPDMASLDRAAVGAKGIYLMPNSRNPTGTAISPERRRALVEWSRRRGVPLVEDDYGADLVLDDTPVPVAMRALDPDVLYVSTFSKRLIPALRVGFVVCPPAFRDTLLALKHTMDLGTSALLQHALAEFLERGYLRSHLARTLPVYRARRDALEAALAQHLPTDVGWSPLRRGLVMWLELPERIRADELFVEAQRCGVLTSPATLHTPSGRAQTGLRLTIAAEAPERIALGVERLGTAIRNLAGGHRNRGPSVVGI